MKPITTLALLLVSLAGTGCIHSIGSRAGEPLPAWPAKVEGKQFSVAITRWTRHMVQRFDMQTQYSTDHITQTWRQAPGEKDKSALMYGALKDAGVEHVTFQPDTPADYFVAGYFTSRDASHFGLLAYNTVFALFPTALFSPVPPMLGQGENDMVVSVYDSEGRLLKSRKVLLENFTAFFGYYGLMSAGGSEEKKLTQIAVAVALDIISKSGQPAAVETPGGDTR